MSRSAVRLRGLFACAGLASITILLAAPAQAGWPFSKRQRTQPAPAQAYVPTAYPAGNAASPMLGTFYPTPYMSVRGNAPAGGGYSVMEYFGEGSNLSIYGPMSALRTVAAPVDVYERGYDGRVYANRGTGYSYPYMPPASPLIYPTQATYYWGPRESGTPPWWNTGANWVDQN